VAQQTKEAPKKEINWRGLIGFLVFLGGIVLAVIGGLVAPGEGTIILILVLLGIAIGFLNITAKEAIPMMIAAIALITVGRTGFEALNDISAGFGDSINDVLAYFSQLMAPAAVISAARALLSFALPGGDD